MLVGVWLVVSPSVLDYRPEDSAWNPVVCGAIVTVVAAIRVAGAWAASVLSWVSALIGAWLFVSAFTLAESQQRSGTPGSPAWWCSPWPSGAPAPPRVVERSSDGVVGIPTIGVGAGGPLGQHGS